MSSHEPAPQSDQATGGVTPPDEPARDAIVFVPGLYQSAGDAEDGVARRILRALEHHARSGTARFALEDARDLDYGEKHKARTVSIVRRQGNAKQAVADLYEFNYEQALTGAYRKRKPALQAISIAFILLANIGRLVGAFRKTSKSPLEKLQVLYGGLIFLVLAAYVPVLVAGVLATGAEAVQTYRQQPAPDTAAATTPVVTDPAAPVKRSWLLQGFQFVVLFASAAGFFTRASLKDFLSETAAHAVPALNYLDFDERKGAVMGQLNDLLDHLEQSARPYANVHVIAYSFGSIVALDALFPAQVPSPRLERVKTLTTIGSPFDFMRTYWPGYFTGRYVVPGAPSRWLNIYSTMDILGSDFRDTDGGDVLHGVRTADDQERKPDENKRYGRDRRLSLAHPIDYLGLVGFRAHCTYWDKTETYGLDCFDIVVPQLYGGTTVLS